MNKYDYSYSVSSFYEFVRDIKVGGRVWQLYKCAYPDSVDDKLYFVSSHMFWLSRFCKTEKEAVDFCEYGYKESNAFLTL